MYIYIYTCIYVYMYIFIYVYMYICIYVYMYICIYVYMYIRICVCMYYLSGQLCFGHGLAHCTLSSVQLAPHGTASQHAQRAEIPLNSGKYLKA